MKKKSLFSIFIIWIIIFVALLNILPVKAINNNDAPLPIYKLYLPFVGYKSSPEITFFNENEVIVRFPNIPNEYTGSYGLIWITGVAGNNFLQEIELNWVGKTGTTGEWRGIIPFVPYAGYYYLKNGLIFYNGYGSPALIPESKYTWLNY
jgi:hypothetical protein